MNFKAHKIPGIDLKVCCKEQKVAYNYLFSWSINEHNKDYILDCIQKELASKAAGTYNELYKPFHTWKPGGVDYDLVYHYILESYDRYIATNHKIFGSYSELSSVIYSDYFQAA